MHKKDTLFCDVCNKSIPKNMDYSRVNGKIICVECNVMPIKITDKSKRIPFLIIAILILNIAGWLLFHKSDSTNNKEPSSIEKPAPIVNRLSQSSPVVNSLPQPAVAGDWGILAEIPKCMGPGSRFQTFLKALKANTPRDHGWTWALLSIDELSFPRAHFLFTVTGEGKFFSEMIIAPLGQDLFVTMLFRDSMGSDLKKAVNNRNMRIMQAAMAMSLTDEELKRLINIMALLPLARESAVEGAMWDFVGNLPGHIQTSFRAAWQMEHDDNVFTTSVGFGPAIGFPLSDKHIVDIGFCPLDALDFYRDPSYKGKFGKFGPWWTVAIRPLWDHSYTQDDDEPQKVNKTTIFSWPRLTLKEVDALVDKLEQFS